VRSFSLTLGALPNLDPRRRRQNQAFEEHAHRVVSIRDLPKTLPSLVSLPTILPVIEKVQNPTGMRSQVGSELSSGLGIDAAAAALGASRETTRTQLKSIFAKTNTRRQAELAGLLADAASNAANFRARLTTLAREGPTLARPSASAEVNGPRSSKPSDRSQPDIP
jgi:hypothetical protein